MPTWSSYVRLTNEQKQELRDHYAIVPDRSYRELGAWAATTFQLARPPSRTTLHRALQQPDKTLRPSAKSNRDVTSALLERKLLLWIVKCEEFQPPVAAGATICDKAARLRDEIVSTASAQVSSKLNELPFSNGWLYKFQLRHSLSSKRVHGEAASADLAAVSDGRAALQILTASYARRDIFNLDETAYFYCAPPRTSISARPLGKEDLKGEDHSRDRVQLGWDHEASAALRRLKSSAKVLRRQEQYRVGSRLRKHA